MLHIKFWFDWKLKLPLPWPLRRSKLGIAGGMVRVVRDKDWD